jgi:hypothetical protein
MLFLHKLLDAISRCRAQEIDEEVVSLARRNFLRRASSTLALPLVAPLLADQLIELLQPSKTIFLPPAPSVWAVKSLGGFFYSRQLSDVITMNIQPLTRFRQSSDAPSKLTWNVHGW